METTKPFLFIDLQKSWREDFHPRDKFGKFSAVKGGSRVVTKAGKTGVVEEAGATHHTVRYDDGKKAKVAKDNVIHAKDHQKVLDAQKAEKAKVKKTKATAEKAKATKTANKTNATGKTGASKKVEDPTAGKKAVSNTEAKKQAKAPKVEAKPAKKTKVEAPKAEKPVKGKTAKQVDAVRTKNAQKKATEARKTQKQSKKQRDLEAPVLKRQVRHDVDSPQEVKQTIPQKKHSEAPEANKMNQEIQSAKNVENEPSEEKTSIDSMWGEKASKLMSKAPEKRSAKDIKRIAGEITQANDKLARHVVNKMANARGISMSQNIIGNKATRAEKVIRQDTGLYGDMLQSARASMFETLHNVLSGSQNPGGDTSIGKHVVRRMKDKLHRDLYGMLNDMPAPHEMRGAIGEARKHEQTLTQKLGRTPSHEELANHLHENSKIFREATIPKAPKWDEKANDWVATKEKVSDPSERLSLLNMYANQQKAGSIDKNVGKEGEKDVTLADSMSERTASSPEEAYEAKERQKELQGALPKAMKDMGLSDDEIKTMATMYSQSSETGSKANLTAQETAQRLKEVHGMDVDHKWVANRQASAFKKIQQAMASDHPAVAELKKFLMKSFVFNLILKSIYEYDLVKSLHSWGVDVNVLEQRYVRKEIARNQVDLRKSMAPHEYIGSYVVTDEGDIIANVIEFALPERNYLYKSFNEFMTGIQKSMFPHKGGSNHAINQKAQAYVRANSGKYSALQDSQHSRLAGKKGGLSWSEQLQKEKGGVWITWGGKKILINAEDGSILYDSHNEAHREVYNQGAQVDKIDYHHEKEALDEHEASREEATKTAWKEHIASKEATASKSKKGETVDYGKEREAFAKKHPGASFDEDGKLKFERDSEVNDDNRHVIDHGVGAFHGELDDMGKKWKDVKDNMKDDVEHKYTQHYADMSDEDRKAYEGMSKEERQQATGEHILQKDGVLDRLKQFHQDYRQAGTEAEKKAVAQQTLEDLKKMQGEHGSRALVNAGAMLGKDFAKGNFAGILAHVAKHDPSADGNLEDIAKRIGTTEIARGRDEVTKNHIPEGKFMIGNPLTGKTMVVNIGSGFEGGRGGKGGKFAPKLMEAFDPEGGNHEDSEMSWGQLGKLLGYKGDDASKLKEKLVGGANTDATAPFMKPISDEEYTKNRANTKLGLQESMLHKKFELVDQQRDKDGNLKSQTFAQKMEDGTTNHVEIDSEGYVKDPLMRRLLNQRKPVQNAKEVNELLKNGVGNRKWVTAHFGSDIHVGDALGHHIQLEYDGKGAPIVRGGKYDGYRYIDARDVPKGTTDPATGEPVKALFKNGKLVDRRFSTSNEVPMKQGNAVMYQGDKGMKKGRIHSIEGDNYKVTDGKGHVVGIFKKGDLKPAKTEGRTLSNSGQVVVKASQTGTHRMSPSEAFKAEGDGKRAQAKADKAQSLFTEALKKAKVNQGAFDHEGNLNKELELSDAQMKRLQKVLGRSKAGKEMLSKFQSAYTPGLEVHVPESAREAVESTGVTVSKDGVAKISASKFEELRNALGGLSMDSGARDYLADHFQRKDRTPKTTEELREQYQPSTIKTKNTAFNEHFKSQFNPNSYLMDSSKGLYGTQLEGVSHLVERGRGIAGHGMGTGKTILGVVAGLHQKAQALAKGEKPKKTLIVSPKGIMSDWGKEIGSHTNSKALYIGSSFKGSTTSEDGKKMWGQKGTEQEAMHTKSFLKGIDSHHGSDHDFHIVNYDTFMKHRDKFANSGLYDNIAIDEVHAFKNQKGRRGQSLAESTDKFKNVWGLSGTPMENDAREVYSLIDTITGGRHELGTAKEFQDKFMKKDKNGKLVGVKPEMAEKLGDILANVVQFRGGEDVKYNDGSKIQFPHLAGAQSNDPETPSPKVDFIGDMVDRSRDHATNNYYGTKHSVTDFDGATKSVTNAKSGDSYDVQTFTPKNLNPATKSMYDKYNELQQRFLPESKLNELATASATGYDQGKKGGENYLTAMQKLQKFLNAPLSHRMYVGDGQDAFDSDATGVQSEAGGKKKAEGLKEGEHYQVDDHGMKRYFERDPETGSFKKNPDGSPALLPPLHEDNPKAQYLKGRVNQYLDSLHKENLDRVKRGEKPLVPKVVVKSSYTTFGTDIADNVLREVRDTHPIFKHLEQNGHKDLGQGSFTGENDNREQIKGGFRGNKNDYMNNQGNMWATTVSPAGKEGVDFGNAHVMFHYDQDWNPQKMAQFTARVRRSDSAKTHDQAGRANAVRVESLHMPGTVEDFMFNSQDAKMKDISQVVDNTRMAEKNPKLGDTESKRGRGKRGFTTGHKDKAPGAKPVAPKKAPEAPRRPGGIAPLPKTAVAQAEKAMKFVVLL